VVKDAWMNGDVECAVFMVGQSVGLIKDVVSCQDLLDRMVADAETNIRKQLARF
jgi:NADH:quinone reductase (non-electrogenic)